MQRYWLQHGEDVWIPCWLHHTDDGAGQACLATDDGETVTVPAEELKTLQHVHEKQLQGIEDVCALPIVTEGALLHTVRVRFFNQLIYTKVARMLIALNPFSALPIYSSQYLDRYTSVVDSMDAPPHIFGIGADAMQGLRAGSRDQAVLISGESGAGKTESAKLIMSFVAQALRGAGSCGMEEKVLQTSPVLEAFGNSMTLRNNNSSRFGKWLDTQFSGSLSMLGCRVNHYLLEVTRVCGQAVGERSFHIFYQVLQARSSQEFQDLGFAAPTSYQYMRRSELVAPGIDDARCFEETREALLALGFDQAAQRQIFRLVVGVITLGNCEFKSKGEHMAFCDETQVKCAAQLLQVDKDALSKCMLWRKITVGTDVTETPLREHQARAVRDGFSRQLYGLIFTWLIEKINATLQLDPSGETAPKSKPARLLGILDIAGFESFEHNSLEQLLINLSNEHLQQHFNAHVFKGELEDYEQEGVVLQDTVNFMDNSDVLALIDGKGGILELLDEEITVPKATDLRFVTKVLSLNGASARLVPPKFQGKAVFGVRHYAGNVNYTCDGFLDKNADKPPDDMASILAGSKLELCWELKNLLIVKDSVAPNATSSTRKNRSATAKFRNSLRSLIDKINDADPHFIRCIKPNPEKMPGIFSARMVTDQLLLSGVLEAVRIRKQGFSTRLPFTTFVMRYRTLGKSKLPRAPKDDGAEEAAFFRPVAEDLLEKLRPLAPHADDFAIGKTKVFMKERASAALEAHRSKLNTDAVIRIQGFLRGLLIRVRMRYSKKVLGELRSWLRRYAPEEEGSDSAQKTVATGAHKKKPLKALLPSLEQLEEGERALEELVPILDKVSKFPLQSCVVMRADSARTRLVAELEATRQLRELLQRGSTDEVAIKGALARARDLGLGATPVSASLEERSQKLRVQLPLVRAMQAAKEAKDTEQLHDVIQEVEAAGLRAKPEDWLVEICGPALLEEVDKAFAEGEAQRKAAALAAKEAAEAAKKTAETSKQALEAERRAAEAEKEAADIPDQRRSRRVSRRSTLTGLGVVEQAKLLHRLAQATEEYNVAVIGELLGEATSHGIDASLLEAPRHVLEQLQTDSFLCQAVEDATSGSASPNPSASTLRRLQNLSHQIRTLQGDEEVAQSAMHALQRATKRHSVALALKSVFEATSLEELQLAEEAFKDLTSYARLKLPKSWKGHRSSNMLGWMGSVHREGMLSHSKVNIAEALTHVPDGLEPKAVQNFRNVMLWMGDKPAQECQRLAARHDVIELARTEVDLQDEVYVQLMKQLTGCPSPRQALLGWELMVLLCQATSPGDELVEFVRHFLVAAVRSAGGAGAAPSTISLPQNGSTTQAPTAAQEPSVVLPAEVAGYARECITALNARAQASAATAGGASTSSAGSSSAPSLATEPRPSASGGVVATDGGGAVGDDCSMMAVVVHLVDGSSQQMYVPVKMTVGELTLQTGARLGVRHVLDFSFFQLLDGCDAPRLLPDHLVVTEMCDKWQQLKEATGRSSRLLWRRRFLRTDEVLLAGDLAHAALTFRQALTDFLLKPVRAADSTELPVKLAGVILCVEFDHGSDAAVERKLQEKGFMQKLLPRYITRDLRPEHHAEWRSRILDAQREMRPSMDAHMPQIQRMSRTLSLLQGTELFGSHVWSARQVIAAPNAQPAVAGVPARTLKVHPTDAEADVWIFVDLNGVHLVLAQPTPATRAGSTHRSFTFRDRCSLAGIGRTSGSGAMAARASPHGGGAVGSAPPSAEADAAATEAEGDVDRLLRWGARPTFLQLVVYAASSPMLITLLCPQSLDAAFVIHRAISEEVAPRRRSMVQDAAATAGSGDVAPRVSSAETAAAAASTTAAVASVAAAST